MSDWPADIDPTPATKPRPAEQAQFTLGGLLLVIAGLAAAMAIARRLAFFAAVVYLTVVSLAWFIGRPDPKSRAKRVLVSGIVVVAVLALFLPAFNSGTSPRRQPQCQNNLREIAQAIISYQNAKGHLPPPYVAGASGKPLCSWRVLILPYLERRDIIDQWKLDEPWDSTNNKPLSDVYLSIFRCPSDVQDDPRQSLTNYVAVVGPGTAWEEDTKLNTAKFRDGAGNTLLLVETKDSDIHWAEPRDLNFSTMAMTINATTGPGISSRHPGGTAAVLADKRVIFIREDTMPDVLKALLTRNGGETVNSSDFER
jgi:uncharacterized protein DUF1559